MHFSLKAKMSASVFLLATGILFIGGFCLLRYFELSLKRSIAEQQFTLVSRIAEDLDVHLTEVQKIVVNAAGSIPPELLADPDRVQTVIDQRLGTFSHIFDNGVFLFSAAGTLIAESPFLPARRGKDYSFREYFHKTMETGRPYISTPYFSSQSHRHPALNLTAPIRNRAGDIVGVLVGSLDLTGENMLGKVIRTRIGETGYLYLYSTDRTMIMHPDPSRILKQDVPAGVNVLFDRAIDGFEGSGETVNSRGLQTLSSFKRLKTVDWILAANYPAEEAFAPIRTARRHFSAGMAAALVFATLVVWLTMRRFIEPMLHFTRHVEDVANNRRYDKPLEVRTRDEIGVLATSFNRLMMDIQEQKQIVRERLEFLQRLIDTIPNPVYYKNMKGQYLGCNRAFEELFGKTREQVVGMTVADILPAVQAATLIEADAELLQQQSGQFQFFEGDLLHADGTTRNALFYKAVFHDSAGRPAGLIGTIVDITQRKLIEIALAEQREFSENLLQNSAVPCFVIDVNHHVLTWTRACEELTGVSAAEVLGSDRHWQAFYPNKRPCLVDLIVDNELERTVDLYENFADSPFIPEGLRAEGWFPAVGGKTRYLLFEAAPIRDSNGALIAAIETLHDLTILKQAEQALRENEQGFRSLIERSPDAILVHRYGDIVFSNQVADRLLGVRSRDAQGKVGIMDRVHPDFRDLFQARIHRVESLHEASGYTEMKMTGMNGEVIDIEVASAPVYYGGEWAVQTTLRDITVRKEEQERTWRQANFDTLTGIPNRLMFYDRLQQALDHAERQKQHVALLFIDLDRFKEINDTLGHAAGDALLQEVARRLSSCLRKTDTLARLGGDEFTAMMPAVIDPEAVKTVAERMLQRLAEIFSLPGGEGRISGSIGIACYPHNGRDVATLMRQADAAMYRAKAQGRNAWLFYDRCGAACEQDE